MRRTALAVVTLVAAAFLCPSDRLAASSDPQSTPVAAGPAEAVSTEVGYEAFPFAVVDSADRTWVAYSNSTGHVSATGDVRVRYADAGKTWSAPQVVVASSDGYGVGVGGMAAETAAQGGRVWLATVRNQPTSASTATNYSTQVRYRDTAGSWSTPTTLPTISATQTVGSGLLVRPDGTLLAVEYGVPPGGTYSVARVYAYDRTASTWSTLSTVSIAGRQAQEPSLTTMADGRLLMLVRSDATAPYYCYVFGAVSSDGGMTWSVPYRVVWHGSGLPQGYVLPSGEIAVTYRGFTEPTNPPAAYPPRIAMLTPDATAADGAVDVMPGINSRYLYGQITRGPPGEPDRWIYALEGVTGQTGGAAAIYSVPLKWMTRTE